MALTRPTAAQLNSAIVDIADPLISLNKKQTGANNKDIGIVFNRGDDLNVAIIWNETVDQFALINTAETGTTIGNVSVDSYSSLQVGAFVSSGISYPTADGTVGQVLSTNGNGTLSFSTLAAGAAGSNTQVQFNNNGVLAGSANLTFNGTTLTSSGFSGPLTGNASTATVLATARTIGGVSFDGSANINLPGVNTTGNQDTTGNASTATVLATARTINGVSFNGSANITITANTSQELTAGSFLTSTGTFNGGTARTFAVDATSANTANKVVARDASGNFSANVITATSTSARYADLAENYLADQEYPIGTVLQIGGAAEVSIALEKSHSVVGTVSDKPGYLMNSNLKGDYVTPVAYIGRVPCRVKGIVRRSELLVVSDTPGVAIAKTPGEILPGQLVGKALEEYTGVNEGLIEILVGRL